MQVMMKKLIPVLVLSLALLTSCDAISSFIHDDGVVARGGKEKLYLSQLEQYIPDGITPEDSTNLAMQYVTSWASELLYLKVAGEQLSKAE